METEAFTGTARFAILDQLGAGAMCVVYKARDTLHGDVVALKTLKHLDSNSLYRLKQEFRALSHFDHPNLVSFYELVFSEQGWFVTMEMVEGGDFLTFVRGEDPERSARQENPTWASTQDLRFSHSAPAGAAASRDNSTTPYTPLPQGRLPDILRLRAALRQLAEGVAALHEAGRVHRDLKPSNVLVTDAGRVVVLDFGLVAEVDQDYTEGTLHQNIAGSAAYMSPEQSVGKPLSESSDWYSVGVMLYEALTGVWPYSGHLYQILTAKQEYDPPPPADLVAGVPDDLNELCMGLLARDPADRPDARRILEVLRSRRPVMANNRPIAARSAFRFREAQLAELTEAFHAARWGRTVVSLVRGGTGMGKTTLVREFIKQIKVREAVHTMKGRCYEWETVPFKALDGVMDNLSRVLRRIDHRLVSTWETEELPFLAHIFPVLQRVDVLGLEDADLEGLQQIDILRLAFRGLYHLLKQVSSNAPMVIYIDDAHFGDNDSAEILGELMLVDQHLPLQVVLAYNPENPGEFLRRLLPVLQNAQVDVRTVDVDPLSFDESSELAAQLIGVEPGDEKARAVALESAGSPQQIKELSRGHAQRDEAQEPELTEVVVHEIQNLSEPSRRLIQLLSVAGRPLDTALALSASELGDDAFKGLTDLRAHNLIRTVGDLLEVTGDRIMEFVVDRMAEDDLRTYHLALGYALEATGEYDPATLVHHYASGGNSAKAGLVAWLSAEAAVEANDLHSAAWLLDQAWTHGEWSARERRTLNTQMGQTHAYIGNGKGAAQAWLRAAQDAPNDRIPILRQQAAEQLLFSGYLQEGIKQLNDLLEEVGLRRVGQRDWGSRFGRMKLWWRGNDYTEQHADVVNPEQLLQVDLAWTAAMGLGLVDPEEGGIFQALHLQHAYDAGEPNRVARALATEIVYVARTQSGDWEETYKKAREIAVKYNSWEGQARAAWAAAMASYLGGRWADAVKLATEARNILETRTGGLAWEQFLCQFLLMRSHLYRGDLRSVAQALLPMMQVVDAAENRLWRMKLETGLTVLLRLAEDNVVSAREELTAVMEPWGSETFQLPQAAAIIARAHIALYAGSARRNLWGELDKVWKAAQGPTITKDPVLRVELQLARGRLAASLARSGVSASAMSKEASAAVAAVRKERTPWTEPLADLLEAGVHGAARRNAKAVPLLEKAVQGCEEADMWLYARVARRQLGLLLGANGGGHVEQAQGWLMEQGIVNVDRFCEALAPGFTDDDRSS